MASNTTIFPCQSTLSPCLTHRSRRTSDENPGLTEEDETEAVDKKTLALLGLQDDLVRRAAAGR